MTEYGLTIGTIGFSEFIPISEEAFASIQNAKRLLLFGQGVEEKLELVLENYADFERSILDVALRFSIFPRQSGYLLIEGMHLTNRRVANLLTSARMYLDQVPHDISRTFGEESELIRAFREATNNEYDKHFGYRVMEALRNFVQHRSLPAHNMGLSSSIDRATTPPGIRCRAVPSVNIHALEDDPDFKSLVLEELRESADDQGRIELVPHVREYVECLGRVHFVVRDAVAKDLGNADEIFAQHMTVAAAKFNGSLAGLEAVARDDSGEVVEREHLFANISKRRLELTGKNTDMDGLSKRFVSGGLA